MDVLLRKLIEEQTVVPTDLPLIHIGFSGTQEGMTLPQVEALRKILSGLENLCLHHGDCIGADYQAHVIAREFGYPIITHPPQNDTKRAFSVSDESRTPKPYLARNKDVVDETMVLIAAPKNVVEELRSGTWSTVRYARQKHKPVILIFPDGQVHTIHS